MTSRTGFTLLEVMLALLVLTVGLLALAGTLGPTARMSGEGRARGRIAVVLESRLDRMRAQLLLAAPACVAPGSGTLRHPDGVVESWSATLRAGLIEVQAQAQLPGRTRKPDSLVSRLPCP